MAEGERAALIDNLLTVFLKIRLGNFDKLDDDEREREHANANPKERGDVAHACVIRHSANHDTGEEGGQCASERVHCAANLYELVAAVTAAAQDVEHRVDDRVEHADAEAANEGAKEVDEEVERNGLAVIAHYLDVVAEDAGRILYEKACYADNERDERRLLIADLGKHLAGGNSHEEIGCEVHHVAHHLGPFVLHSPDVAKRSSHVRHE